MNLNSFIFAICLSAMLNFTCCSLNNENIDYADDAFQYVNPFIGTLGEGHTYPGATVPHGMIQLSPDTDIKHFSKSFAWCAGYQYSDSSIIGFSHTHFSGTGHSDMGDVLVMPGTGKINFSQGSKENPDNGYRSRFSHKEEHAEPGYYQVMLKDYKINCELSTSMHTGFHKYTFPESDQAYVIMDLVSSIYNYKDKVLWSEIRIENDSTITGYRQTKGWAANRHVYFAMRFSKSFKDYILVNEEEMEYKGFGFKGYKRENHPSIEGKKLKAAFNFSTNKNEVLMVKVSISGVDIKGALNNLEKDIQHWNFEQTRKEAKTAWQKELNKIQIKAAQKEKEIFYTSMYHSLLAPTIYMDIDRRYRGIDQSIHFARDFDHYSTWSLWDTYRALHPLLTILQPDKVGDMVNSMLAHQEQSVHKILPVWAFHANETWCMIGYHAVPVIADAMLKNIKGFNYNQAYDACIASATNKNYAGLNHYMNYGYVPIDLEHEGASKTLEYAYDDFCIYQLSKKLNRLKEIELFKERALSFENCFDPKSRFMRAKNSKGLFRVPFDPLYAQYGGDYTEGNAWQYSWYVPHDPEKLISLMGGKEAFIQRLDSLFVIQADEEKFKHVEDIAGLIGQYAHGNEPSQHIAYLYNYAGAAWKTQEKIDQIMQNLFNNTPDGICGNEDCGQMSAWYIFSSMGFYPVSPGTNEYVIGKPCLEEARIRLENGKEFKMIAKNLSAKNKYISKMTLNGKTYYKSYIRHEDIINGGELVFEMSKTPNTELKLEVPFSLSTNKSKQ